MGKRQGINKQEKFGNQRSLKRTSFLHLLRDREVDSACLELLFIKIHGQKIARVCVKLLRILRFKPKSSIEQYFKDIKT